MSIPRKVARSCLSCSSSCLRTRSCSRTMSGTSCRSSSHVCPRRFQNNDVIKSPVWHCILPGSIFAALRTLHQSSILPS